MKKVVNSIIDKTIPMMIFVGRFTLAFRVRDKNTIRLGIAINIALDNKNAEVIWIPAISLVINSLKCPGS